jgi:hypothetical protein
VSDEVEDVILTPAERSLQGGHGGGFQPLDCDHSPFLEVRKR